MFAPRPLAVAVVFLTFVTAFTVTSASAQVPDLTPTLQVPGSISLGGNYVAHVTEPSKDFWDRAGTYQASVTFTAAVSVSIASVETPSGGYQASGPFTATVSAPDVKPFVVSGTFTASGTFSAGTYASSGQWVVNTGGQASGSHRGGGTYDLAASSVFASGQWDGVATNSARGPFSIDGTYSGNGTFTVGAMRMSTTESLQVAALADMIAGIAGMTASPAVAAAAIEMQNPTRPPVTTPPAAGAGGFAGGAIAAAGVSIVSFTGTVAQLNTAAGAAKVITVSAAIGGKMLTSVVGAPPFVNADFNSAFPAGLNGTLVIVKT
ncbi:MAG: hypothetical protein EPO65_01665 [Dehalococcoidia bacterium]|nr:MAG: hypothetical protein EPO65_01665 [Dehalococcoidia bacterium]